MLALARLLQTLCGVASLHIDLLVTASFQRGHTHTPTPYVLFGGGAKILV